MSKTPFRKWKDFERGEHNINKLERGLDSF